MPFERKRRSQSQSSSDESDIKRIKDEIVDINLNNELFSDQYMFTSSSRKVVDKKPRKSELIVLDCKKLDPALMLLMYNPVSTRWVSLPMPEIPKNVTEDPEELQRCFCMKNVIGFMNSSIIFWKDNETLVSLNAASYAVKMIPSMTMGRTSHSSTWRYFCGLNKLIAVNIFSPSLYEDVGDGDNEAFENGIVNIMTYDFRECGWEKRAEHHFQKMRKSNPHILYIETKDGLWLCIADHFLNNNSFKLQKNRLHLLFIENYTWGLEEIECSVVSRSYCEGTNFLSLAIDEQGMLAVINKPYIYKYDSSTGDWHSNKCMDMAGRTTLTHTISVQGLKGYYFTKDGAMCDFCSANLDKGDSESLDIPPLYIYQKKLPRYGAIARMNRHRITNTVESSKLTAFLVEDKVLHQTQFAAWNKFECEF